MRRFRCTVAYIGAAYDGWQSQKLGLSIQEQIESVLEKIEGKKVNIIGSGRTDAGVNARRQVFMFDTENEKMGARKWMGALNGFLPRDIHITEAEEVSPLFHARHNVRWKKYTYRVNTGMYDVFNEKIAYQCPIELDFETMQETAKLFVGKHDFTSFNSSPLSLYPDQTRTITRIDLHKEGNLIEMDFYGKGFLHYMVRMLSAAIIETGKHKQTTAQIREMLEAKSKRVARRNAPAQGLTLEYVDYFEMVALGRNAQIREFLMDDALPFATWTLSDLEARVREHGFPRAYIFCTRTHQNPQGYLCVYEENGRHAELVLDDPENSEMYVEEIREQLQSWMKENGIEEDLMIRGSEGKIARFGG